jgi:putative ABC transport system permease protein
MPRAKTGAPETVILMNDLKFALRALIKSPFFSFVAIVTLALGIGLNTAMFSLVNSLYLRPLPFGDPGKLVRLYRGTSENPFGDFSPADYQELRSAEAGFGHFAGSSDESVSVSAPGAAPELEDAFRVSSNYFEVLKVRPEMGRVFRHDEETHGKDRVAVISHAMWMSRFAGAADILGRTIRIDGEPHDIIGVLPESADDGRVIRHTGVFRPLGLGAAEMASRGGPWLRVIGRRDSTISVDQGKAFVAALGERVAHEFAKEDAGASWRSEDLLGSTGNQSGKLVVAMLLGLSGFVLLIACSNLANFVLARTIERSQELSVRSALGASRFQLVRPLALESFILAGVGGLSSLPIASWSARWLSAQSVANGGSPMAFPLDWRVLGFALLASLATALFFGTAPALLISRLNINRTLKSGMRGATAGSGHQRMRRLLVIAQFAMAMTLLAGAGFLASGADNLVRHHYGWDSGNVVVGDFDLPKAKYDTPEKILAFQRQLTGRLASVPGATSVALAYALPYTGQVGTRPYLVEGRDRPAKGQETPASYNGITPDFFRVTGSRLLAGRAFGDSDTAASARVAIINQGMARALFANDNPVGHRIARADTDKPEWSEIVGVAGDVLPTGIYQQPSPFQVYHPLAQEPWQFATFGVRAAPGALKDVLAAVGAAFAAVDMDLPVRNLMTADARIERSSFDLGMLKRMLGAFALLGLSLAALGIYGVIARTVAYRTQEIGIRMALGATMADVSRLILGSGLKLGVAGAAIGLAGAVGITRLLASMMPAVDASVAGVVAGAAAVLAAVALVASYLPSRAASRVDPAAAIRAE